MRITVPTDTPPIAQPTNCVVPTGGVFSPSAQDVAHARRVKEAMGDGTGAVMLDGKMEDDASLKQCLVILELADRLSANDPELAALYAGAAGTTDAGAQA